MNRRARRHQNLSSETAFRLRPLAACIRALVVGSLFAGNATPSNAELPVPINPLPVPVAGSGFATSGAATWSLPNSRTLNINQKTDKAILNWHSFDVDKGNAVKFAQPNSSSVALNRINDTTANPSRILGSVSANGQIYLVNKNGFVFEKGSVVDASGVVASALNISNDAFDKGIIRVYDQSKSEQAAFNGQRDDASSYEGVNPSAKINVATGAKIHAGKNGNIILAAPAVNNSGSISAEQNGQILMAASKDKVYLKPASSESPFAGLLVEVDAGGQVSNDSSGDISVRQGNITLAGFAVRQDGKLKATTSVNVNGSVRLLARETRDPTITADNILRATSTTRPTDADGLGKESSVTFGKNSSVSILAERDGAVAIDEQAQKQSHIEVSANKIKMESGSAIVAPSGSVNFTATDNLVTGYLQGTSGRIYMEGGSRIDVSGTKQVKVDMERNVAEVSVQTFNLRNSPYQKGGILQGNTVKVDIRKDTKILDASSGADGIKRGIDERLGKGGDINLSSSGDVIVNQGAVADISGGSVRYKDGYIDTTKLLSRSGQLIDISAADPNESYVSVFGTVSREHAKWGITETWGVLGSIGTGHFEKGYTEGKAAGSLNIQSPLVSWNGEVVAGSVSSIYQRENLTSGGKFSINSMDNAGNRAGIFLTSQNVLFQTQAQPAAIGFDDPFPLNDNGKGIDLALSTALVNQSGLSEAIIKTGGNFTLTNDAAIYMPALSKLTVDAPRIDILGSVYSAGGTLSLNGANTGNTDSGTINLAATSLIDVSGRWINDFQKGISALLTEPLSKDGGTVSVKSDRDLNFDSGAMVKVDGGAWLAQDGGQLTSGKAGKIELSAGNSEIAGVLHLNGLLSATSLYGEEGKGGDLTLSSNKINVGAHVNESNALNLGVSNGSFDFAPQFGFSSLTLKSNANDITVKAGTDLTLVTQNRDFTGTQTGAKTIKNYSESGQQLPSDYRNQASSKSLADFTKLTVLPEHLRKPVHLTLDGATGVTLETGSSIRTDKQSTVDIVTSNQGKGIFIDGLVEAPSGSITVKLNADKTTPYDPKQSIWLGSQASLTTHGTTLLNPIDTFGNTIGEVLPGGKITVAANRGYIVLEAGSNIDVSGTRTKLDIPMSNTLANAGQYVKRTIGSDAGSISLSAAEGMVLDGSFNGQAGSATNRGGRLDLTLDRSGRNEDAFGVYPINPLAINVIQEDRKLLADTMHFGAPLPDSQIGQTTVSSQKVAQAGIDNLHLTLPAQFVSGDNDQPRLPGEIRFLGDVNLSTAGGLYLDAQTVAWSGLNSAASGFVNLSTTFLEMGSTSTGDNAGASVLGGGKLTTNARWTQLTGASLFTGFKQINLNSLHELRAVGVRRSSQRNFSGSLLTQADLNLNAGQIYPTTLSNYKFEVTNPIGQLTVSGQNADQSPLSAAGQLTLKAPVINQNGILKAPLGTIELDASTSLSFGKDSLTSVSADGLTIPLGVVAANVWKYPLDRSSNLVFNEKPDNTLLGEKHLVFKSPSVDFKTGSVVDVSGGGDLQAYEFQPGSGGDFDYLDPSSKSYQGGFAILPSLASKLSPYDHNFTSSFGANGKFSTDPGAQVYLSASKGLPAGKYTILPAQYALLPGAFLVTPQVHTQDQITTFYTKSGLPVVPGYNTFAGLNTRDPRTSGFLIENRNQVRKQSEYGIQSANEFFTQRAASKETNVPLLPADSGQISIDASAKLALDGVFKVASPNGKGAKLDISSDNIKIVKNVGNGSTGELEILDQDLSNLHVDSLLLGGNRLIDNVTGHTTLTVNANNVTFDQGTQVNALDLVAAGKNSVVVKSGASIISSGKVNTGDSIINISDDSALLRVSADKQITINRSYPLGSVPGTSGSLLVESGAVLTASKSMLLDGSKATILDGEISMKGGSLSLTANAINLGEITGQQGDSLNLSNQKLAGLSVDELLLNSRGLINLYGNVGKPDNNGLLAPLQFNRLVLDSKGLSGFDNAGKAARLQAASILVQNSSELPAPASVATGTGSLDLTATDYQQGGGVFGFDGFNAVNINVAKQFTGIANSLLNVASNLNVTADSITTTEGHKLEIDASSGAGHDVIFSGNVNPAPSVSNDFGGIIDVKANNITFNRANVLLPSGTVNLQAQTGDILVTGNSDINLAGRAVNFADIFDYTPGGVFSADAKTGKVMLDKGSTIDVSSGGGTAAGGNLIFRAPEQSLDLLGNIKATGASAIIDVAGFSSTASFDSLMNKLSSAGVSESVYFRTHNADIIQASGNAINTSSLTLVSDKGAIDLSGVLNADGEKVGGSISLFAGGKITLENGALITAKGSDKGGDVLLSSVPADPLLPDTSGIEIKPGSAMDVSGSSASSGGVVTLRALRTADNINIQPVSGTVKGASRIYAEGVKLYNNADLGGNGAIDSADITNIDNETAGYMTAASQNVASTLGSGILLRPGVEINYTGDLTVASPWDFSTQRFGQNAEIPGNLVVAASGNLNVTSPLTDGFLAGVLQTGDSWSFQLVSGADRGSADKFATLAENDLNIGSNVSIHTGTGDIKLASGGDINLADQTSTIYNAGRADATNPYGTLDGIQILDYSLPNEINKIPEKLAGSEYPIAGGDLIIHAGGNIAGAVSNQFITAWLNLQGDIGPNDFADENHLTAWAVNASGFQQNIGSFGGGKVDITASGNINDLSVMMPTTGKQRGLDLAHNSVEINGGGQMQINAGGNISGGAYFLGKGTGNIFAAGEIKGSDTGSIYAFNSGPQLVMSGDRSVPVTGDSKLTLTAGQGLRVAAASDAMMMSPHASGFFSYTDNSNLALKSFSGDVHLNSDTSLISNIFGLLEDSQESALTSIYPASLDVTAFNGSILLDKDILLFPSPVSNLNILANRDIQSSAGQFSIIMSDADLLTLPSASSPGDSNFLNVVNEFDTGLIETGKATSGDFTVSQNITHAPVPVHSNDAVPARLVTQIGDINSIQINLPKQAIIQAGRDLKNSPVIIQQVNANDASVISAGRDLFFETNLDLNGNLDTVQSAFNRIEIAGPGDATIKTGRNLDLGASVGLTTVGNIFNAGLSNQGASLDVLVGLNGATPDYAAFINKYQSNPLYAKKFNEAREVITDFMRQRSGNLTLSKADAFAEFGKLKGDSTLSIQTQLNALLSQVFFNELKVAGSASAEDKSVGNAGGYAAIDTLYPGNPWKGDLTLFFSKLQTISGGDINLYVPGGQVNAGLAVAPSGQGAKTADQLGIVVQREGQINAFVKDDFTVNTSRVFTLGGGDILIWSSEGDIDAGKGAKSALSVTVDPPFFNDKNVLVIPAPKITNGSGIRTASTGESAGDVGSKRRDRLVADKSLLEAGDLFLIAPKGVVNAGEAGIAGNNVTISATAVLGANNIQVSGVSSGVPTTPQSAAAGLTGTSNLSAGVTQAADASMAASNKAAADKTIQSAMGIVTVDILGFGENNQKNQNVEETNPKNPG